MPSYPRRHRCIKVCQCSTLEAIWWKLSPLINSNDGFVQQPGYQATELTDTLDQPCRRRNPSSSRKASANATRLKPEVPDLTISLNITETLKALSLILINLIQKPQPHPLENVVILFVRTHPNLVVAVIQ